MSAILKMLDAADKATPANWVVCKHLIPYTWDCEATGPVSGTHIENLVMTDWEHPQMKGPLAINGVGRGLGLKGNAVPLEAMQEYDSNFIAASRNATEDFKKLVKWLEGADHKQSCLKWTHSPSESSFIDDGYACTCGLDEIQSLIRS